MLPEAGKGYVSQPDDQHGGHDNHEDRSAKVEQIEAP
jgi:hypothetical protein